MAIELSNQDAQEEVALIQQMAKDAELARTLQADGAPEPEAAPPDDPLRGASPLLQRPPSSAPGAHSPLVVEVSVPPRAQPGSKLQVAIPDGRFVEVQLPPGATPGELLRVQVPRGQPSADVSHSAATGNVCLKSVVGLSVFGSKRSFIYPFGLPCTRAQTMAFPKSFLKGTQRDLCNPLCTGKKKKIPGLSPLSFSFLAVIDLACILRNRALDLRVRFCLR